MDHHRSNIFGENPIAMKLWNIFETLDVPIARFFAVGSSPRDLRRWDVTKKGSSLFRVGNRIIESSVSPPCALCLCGGSP